MAVAALLVTVAACGERYGTIDPSLVPPADDLSGLNVPEGALLAMPDSRVFAVGGPEAIAPLRRQQRGSRTGAGLSWH